MVRAPGGQHLHGVVKGALKLRILAVGRKPPQWVESGYAEFAKRFPKEMTLELHEIPAGRHHGDRAKFVAEEAERLSAKIGKGDWVVALDERGKAHSSEALSARMAQWRMHGGDVSFLIGGADGLAPSLLARADETLSLSHLTFPHHLARLVLAEALYRAWSIGAGHPYHRA